VIQRREAGQPSSGADWIDLAPVAHTMTNADDEGDDSDSPTSPTSSNIQVNRYFAEHPEMVLESIQSCGVHYDAKVTASSSFAGRKPEWR
jgi:hypothetical protein